MNEEESKYAANINTHIDFLIYNRVDVYKRQVALLGSTANKEKFIETQEEEKQYPEHFESWHDADRCV